MLSENGVPVQNATGGYTLESFTGDFYDSEYVEVTTNHFDEQNITGTLNIPSTITSIGSYAFDSSTNLLTINFLEKTSLSGITLGEDWSGKATIQCSGSTCS